MIDSDVEFNFQFRTYGASTTSSRRFGDEDCSLFCEKRSMKFDCFPNFEKFSPLHF